MQMLTVTAMLVFTWVGFHSLELLEEQVGSKIRLFRILNSSGREYVMPVL